MLVSMSPAAYAVDENTSEDVSSEVTAEQELFVPVQDPEEELAEEAEETDGSAEETADLAEEVGDPAEEAGASDGENTDPTEEVDDEVSGNDLPEDGEPVEETDGFLPEIPTGEATFLATGDTELGSGTCGTSASWSLSSDYVLTISGSGAMKDYLYISSAPWYSKRSDIKPSWCGAA